MQQVNRNEVMTAIVKTIRANIPDADGFQKWATAYTLALSVLKDETLATEMANELEQLANWEK